MTAPLDPKLTTAPEHAPIVTIRQGRTNEPFGEGWTLCISDNSLTRVKGQQHSVYTIERGFLAFADLLTAAQAKIARLTADVEYHKKCRLQEKAKITRQRDNLAGQQAELDRLKRELKTLQRTVSKRLDRGDPLGADELVQCVLRIENQRTEIGRLIYAYDALAEEIAALRTKLATVRANALEDAAKVVDPAKNAKSGLWAENLRRKAAAIRALGREG